MLSFPVILPCIPHHQARHAAPPQEQAGQPECGQGEGGHHHRPGLRPFLHPHHDQPQQALQKQVNGDEEAEEEVEGRLVSRQPSLVDPIPAVPPKPNGR